MNGGYQYQTQKELMEDCMVFLDAICSAYLGILQAQSPECFEGRGVVIPESQILAALSSQQEIPRYPELYAILSQIKDNIQISELFPMKILMQKVCQNDVQLICLLLAIAPEWNRKYERIFAYLQDNIQLTRATFGFALDLCRLAVDVTEYEEKELEDDWLPLNRYALHRMEQGHGTFLAAPILLGRSARIFLTGLKRLPAILDTLCRRIEVKGEEFIVREEMKQAAVYANSFFGSPLHMGILQICGGEGSGRQTTLRYLAAELSREILVLEISGYLESDAEQRKEIIDTYLSYCFWTDSIPAIHRENGEDIKHIVKAFDKDFSFLVVLGKYTEETQDFKEYSFLELKISPLSLKERRQMWEFLFKKQKAAADKDIDFNQLASVYTLTPGRMEQVIKMALASALANGEEGRCIAAEHMEKGVNLLCNIRLREYANMIDSSFEWEDLQVEEQAKQKLKQVCNRMRFHYQVRESWGFQKKLPYGNGMVVLLYGPPGTGKTMAAQILAKKLGLCAYRVDISRMFDKYIGETEKRIGALFDAAGEGNALLFFDEADALFAKRTEVSDAKDKHSNAETAYLLQRIEEHNGVSILSTNAVQNMDAAFRRRIHIMIHMPMPGVLIRTKLWESVFPQAAPIEEDVDVKKLAKQFELNGSQIKNIALQAAFLAAEKKSKITNALILEAVREEYEKNGRLFIQ